MWSKMEADLQSSELLSSSENEEVSTSLARAVYLSKAKLLQRRELTAEELKLFAWEVEVAKRAELASFCSNEAFEIVETASMPCRAQTGRWVLTWKRTKTSEGEGWVVKARLVVRGFEDGQAQELNVRSPTAGKTSQRLILHVGAMMEWEVMSADIPTAFLQGNPLQKEKTSSGGDRIAAMRPPADTWDLLPSEWRLWPGTDTANLCWRLLVAVYGLKDGPKMFIEMLSNWLKESGWASSRYDEQIFYFREVQKNLARGLRVLSGMISVHMDDLAMTGVQKVLRWICDKLSDSFGRVTEVTFQRVAYRHLGFAYKWLGDSSYTMDLKQYIQEAE